MDYKRKYIKYKTKYNKAKGGDFNFNENDFQVEKYQGEKEKEFKYIAGPVRLVIMENDERTIYLFGDRHVTNEKFNCGIGDDENTIYLTEYLERMFINEKKHLDFFVEAPLTNTRTIKFGPGLIENVRKQFGDCFGKLEENIIQEKKECRKIYERHRFHMCDARRLVSEDDLTEESSTLHKFIAICNDSITDAGYYKFSEVSQNIIYLLSTIVPEYCQHPIVETGINFLRDTRNGITLKNWDYYYEELIEQLTDLLEKQKKENVIREANYLRDYIQRINKIYKKINDISKLFYVNKFNEDFDKTSLNYLVRLMYEDNKFKKNMPPKNIIKKIIEVYHDEKIITRDYNYLHDYKLRYEKSSVLLDQQMFYKAHIIKDLELFIMDTYLLGRMFKTFDNDKFDRDKAVNSIILAGDHHIEIYIKVLLKLDFKIKYDIKSADYDTNMNVRCIELPEELRKYEFVETRPKEEPVEKSEFNKLELQKLKEGIDKEIIRLREELYQQMIDKRSIITNLDSLDTL